MSATQPRDRACHLAKHDPQAALLAAHHINDAWFRVQALSTVARFSSDKVVQPIINEALASCRQCRDSYQSVGAAAWPIRALIERGLTDSARQVLLAVRSQFADVQPPSSRSEAVFLLFQAAFALGFNVRAIFVADLFAINAAADNWRSSRCLVESLNMLAATEPNHAATIASSITDERVRRRALARVRADVHPQPRPFFW